MKRSKWKGLYVKPSNYNKESSITSRKTLIVPNFIGKTLKVHNGKKLKEILITNQMLNHKLGEFFKTRANFEFKKKKKKKK